MMTATVATVSIISQSAIRTTNTKRVSRSARYIGNYTNYIEETGESGFDKATSKRTSVLAVKLVVFQWKSEDCIAFIFRFGARNR